tara:strand:+ start:1310 stop:1534 length:225 start_codon:yes stop_codon:yes gene_type:complete
MARFNEEVPVHELYGELSELVDNINAIKEFGTVGCYDMNEEIVRTKGNKAVELLRNVNTILNEINSAITESYEY